MLLAIPQVARYFSVRDYHSTEKFQWKVQNDILMHLDKSDTVIAVLFDISAAFKNQCWKLIKKINKNAILKQNILYLNS